MKKSLKCAMAGALLFVSAAFAFADDVTDIIKNTADSVMTGNLITSGNACSNTSVSTCGTLSTDVDNFMNVNYWNTVNPKNYFAYSNLVSNLDSDFYSNLDSDFGLGALDLGFAKQFKKFYLGVCYTGNLWGNIKSSYDTTTLASSSLNESSNELSALLGIKKWGIKLSTRFDNNVTVDESTTNKIVTISTTDKSKYGVNLSAGTSLMTKKTNLTPYFGIGYSNRGDTTTTVSSSTTSTTEMKNYSNGYVNIEAGTGIALLSRRGIDQSFNVPVDVSIITLPEYCYENASLKYKLDASGYIFSFAPSYRIGITPADNVKVAANFKLPISYSSISCASLTKITSTSTSTNYNLESSSFSFSPAIDLGLQYVAKPDKFIVNFGLDFAFPQVVFASFKNTKTKDESASSVSNGFDTSIKTGVTYYFTKNINVDAAMNIFTSSDEVWNADVRAAVVVKY